MGAEARGTDGEAVARWWNDPRVAGILMTITYACGGVGIALGIYGYTSDGAVKGLHYAFVLMVGAVGVISGIRHTVFYRSDSARMGVQGGTPFFQWETGFANAAIGIVALIAFFSDWGGGAEVALMLTYAVYLAFALSLVTWRRASSKELDAGMILPLGMWALTVGFMLFFGIAAAVSGELSLF